MYCLFCDVPCIVCVYMCTEQLPPGGYPIAFNIYHIIIINKHSHDTTRYTMSLLLELCLVLFSDVSAVYVDWRDVNRERYKRKQPSPNFKCCRGRAKRGPASGQPLCGQRYEHGTPKIRSRVDGDIG